MTQSHSPRGRAAPATSTATRGVIVVVFALFVGFMLLWKGGGGASEGTPENDLPGTTAADSAQVSTTLPAPATAVPAAQLKVVVANGSNIKGLAGQTADQLKAAGYTATTATDATQDVTTSQVYFVEGNEGDAQAVATAIGLPAARVVPIGATPPPIAALGDNKVVVILGPDAPGAGGTAAATTTAPA
jgi:hypothetical protein